MKLKSKIYKKIIVFSLTSMLFSLNGCKENNDNNTLSVSFENITNDDEDKIEYEYLDSIDELKKYFSEDITFDMVRQSLENNHNISDEYREYTNEFINLLEQKYPNIDLTIFNENIKIFNVYEITANEMKEEKTREAYYDVANVSITMHNEHNSIDRKKYCYFHELWHMFNNLCLEVDGIIFYKTPTLYELDGTAFDEGMNTFLTEQLIDVGLSSYVRQLDQIKILHEIYGDELIYIYLDSGIEGVEIRLAKDIGYREMYELIKNMNYELEEKLNDPTLIFNILANLYVKSGKENRITTNNIIDILENLIYDKEVKEQILLNFDSRVGVVQIPEDALVSFDDTNFYELEDLYFVECNEETYIVNDEIVIDFFNKGVIRNVYDSSSTYIGNEKIKIDVSLKEYIKYSEHIYNYDEHNNIVYINKEMIKDGSYVKSK